MAFTRKRTFANLAWNVWLVSTLHFHPAPKILPAMCTQPASMARRQSACGFGRICSVKAVRSFARTASAPATFEASTHRSVPEQSQAANRRPLEVVNWNVAAPNNNPFEYWAAHDDECYNKLMSDVQDCIDSPAKFEIEIGEIFTQTMFNELKVQLAQEGVGGLDQLEHIWCTNLKSRKCISEFLKDRSFGEKRLISMPDRITGWIKNEGADLFRPSPITGFQGNMDDVSQWWPQWKQYIFKTPVHLRGNSVTNVFSMLEKIPRAKYPALTEAEESLSVPLQTLCLALFDAIFTHLLSSVAPETWQPLKRSLHRNLCENKASSCLAILQNQYLGADVVFIQEASESFAEQADRGSDHMVLRPSGVDGRRSQMSLILVRTARFVASTARDVTHEVTERLKLRCVERGDLCAYEIRARDGGAYLLASFHGDSNGKSTVPVLSAVQAAAQELYPAHVLILGLDGNTVSGAASAASPLSVAGLSALLADRGLASCWGRGGGADNSSLDGLWTTFNARTYLQPQLQKAVGLTQVMDRRHMQLKDWIVFADAQLAADGAAARDNTGCRKFVPAVMPSRRFPSDHAIVAVTLCAR